MLTERVAPLYEIKANLFKGLAHPVRIRILEILAAAPDQACGVGVLLEGTSLEASHLSQHLATLRRHGLVTSARTAKTVTYSLAHPSVAELLAIAREFLLHTLSARQQQLDAAESLPNLPSAQPAPRPVSRRASAR